jgi:dienelactone hydrolase
MSRNFSIEEHFRNLAAQHRPRLRFGGETVEDWRNWREQLLPAAKATLGTMPEKVPLNAEIVAEWREDGLVKQKVAFDVEPGLSLHALVFRPEDGGPFPGILAAHGHTPAGKDAIMGCVRTKAEVPQGGRPQWLRRDYGLELARSGYAVIAPDWRGFNERDDRRKPHRRDVVGNRDICNVHFLREVILGRTLLGADVHDGMTALDYLCEQDYVRPERLGVLGCSFGGTMTTWLSLCDERIRASDIICYSDRFADFGLRDTNFCGSQITPGLFALCDVPDLHGLIAPRPLLVEIGVHDQCFRVESALSCFREVERIYAAADARDSLEMDLFEGGHGWGGNKTLPFFDRYLKA